MLSRRQSLLLLGASSLAACATVPGEAANAVDSAMDAFFAQDFDERIARSPQFATNLGDRRGYGQWNDVSAARAAEDLSRTRAKAGEATRLFQGKPMSAQSALSLRLFQNEAARAERAFVWRSHNYRFDHMNGVQSGAATFLLNQHRVTNLADAEAYLSRLSGMKAYLDQQIAESEASAALGVLMPRFVYGIATPAARNIITGAPFNGERASPIWADVTRKIDALTDIDAAKKQALKAEARAAMMGSVAPGYQNVLAMMDRQSAKAGADDGVWRLPKGDDFYAFCLQRHTTTTLSADDIHRIGLENVARLHEEMRVIMRTVNFRGDLKAFFDFMESDPRFYEPQTEAGKASYIRKASEAIDAMKKRLPDFFATLPKADLVVRAVEPFREQSAGLAFYERPALDGSRPGVYYANTVNMKGLPLYQLEALAFHEGVPGHHMQIAIAQELQGVPRFRTVGGGFTAYSEGWALYTELLAKEMGFYTDPYSDFGRLTLELRRAIRLVVDTGLHAKRWPRQKAIDYVLANQPSDEDQARRDIDRYIVMPGQATAYLIGQIEILKLRQRAKDALGARFDIRQFHDAVLRNGAVPLDILGELVDAWVADAKA